MHSPSKRLQSRKEINPIQVLQKILFSFVWGAAIWTQLRTGMPGGSWPLQFLANQLTLFQSKGGGGGGEYAPNFTTGTSGFLDYNPITFKSYRSMYIIVISNKFRQYFLFFTCILHDYRPHESPKTIFRK